MGGFDFEVALQISCFLFAMWFVSWAFEKVKIPPILGQMVVGIFLGPNGMDMVPYASNGLCTERLLDPVPSGSGSGAGYLTNVSDAGSFGDEMAHNHRMLAGAGDCKSVQWDRWETGVPLTNIWTFVGNVGVTLMIMESGMHIHFDKVAAVGKKATIVAIFGTALPIVFGIVVVGALTMGEDAELAFYPWGFAAGCAFAPTSVGISIRLLDESKMLNSMAGQTTLIAAFIDDVFSLVTLVILQTLAKCQISADKIVTPLICSFVFLAIGALLAIKVFPHVGKLLDRIPLEKNASIQPRDQAHIGLMFLSLFFFGWVSSIPSAPYPSDSDDGTPFIGSHLLGAFVAGMVWVNVPRSHAVWERQLKRVVKWMMRCFFGCSVGFAVPVSKMFSAAAVWRGLVMGIGPCVGTKLFSGLFARVQYKSEEAKQLAKAASWATKVLQPQQLLVGIAMVARGEFAYLVAEISNGLEYGCKPGEGIKMMSDDVYAAVMWALVMATICAPVMFRWALGIFDRATAIHRSTYIGGSDAEFQRKAFVIKIAGKYAPGVQREIFNAMYAAGVDVLDSSIVSVRKDDSPDAEISQFINNFTVLSRGKKKDFDDEKLEEMHHAFTEILNDADAQVIFAPPIDVPNKDGVIEVQIIGEHHEELLKDVVDELANMGLDVIKAHIDQSLQPKAHGDDKKAAESHRVESLAPELHPDIVGGLPTTEKRRRSISGAVQQLSPAATGTRSISLSGDEGTTPEGARPSTDGRRNSLTRRFSLSSRNVPQQQAALDHVIYASSQAGQGHGDGKHSVTVGSERFYLRETDKNLITNSKRRTDIKDKLTALLKKHLLHGEVMVRTLHSSEMAIVHTLPKLTHAQKETAIIVKCSGTHHKDLLHEMIDHFTEEFLEVLYAEIDQENGEEVILFWLKHEDDKKMEPAERFALKHAIKQIYAKHGANSKVVIGGEEDEQAAKKLRSMRRVSKETPDALETDAAHNPAMAAAERGAKSEERAIGLVRLSREARNSREKTSPRNSKEKVPNTPATPGTQDVVSVDSVSVTTVSFA